MSVKFKPEIKASLIAALRSGEYKQTTRAMQNDEGYMCAEGVLAELFVKAGNLRDDAGLLFASPEVWQWATGNYVNNGPLFAYKGDKYGIITLNDQFGLSFAEIANIIEQA